jgi:hypothetical protein
MNDLDRFIDNFRTWTATASLPEIDYALSILLLEIAARGPLAAHYVRTKTADALLDLLAAK